MTDYLIEIRTEQMGEISLVGGPHPYLWIGNAAGHMVGTTATTMDLRVLARMILKHYGSARERALYRPHSAKKRR